MLLCALAVSMHAFDTPPMPLRTPHGPPTPIVHSVMPHVSGARIHDSVTRLAAFGTRHALSSRTDHLRGIGAAANWLQSEFEAAAKTSAGDRLTARLENFDAPKSPRLPSGARLTNVVAVLKGSMPEASDRVYYIIGHYDSRNGETMDAQGDAPGANDDASGVAVVLEAARVLASAPPLDATIVFLCTDGEEAGLVGARYHADQLAASEQYSIVAALSNDIVGDPSPTYVGVSGLAETAAHGVRLFSEGLPRHATAEETARIRTEGAESDAPSRQLARFVRAVYERELAPVNQGVAPILVFRQDRFLRGGDHAAFNESGFAAVRFTAPAEDYTRQHVNITQQDGKPYGDLPEFCDPAYMAGVAKTNIAALIHLANAPRPPRRARMLTSALDTRTTLRWDACPEPDTAGYEVVWRATTSPDWTHSHDVGNVTEFKSPISKDNVFFGVRAYDQSGFRSPVSFAWAAKE